jgi:hypothetical protein
VPEDPFPLISADAEIIDGPAAVLLPFVMITFDVLNTPFDSVAVASCLM